VRADAVSDLAAGGRVAPTAQKSAAAAALRAENVQRAQVYGVRCMLRYIEKASLAHGPLTVLTDVQ